MSSQIDSVSIFAEGTFEEQILELVTYISKSRSEEERAAFGAPFHNALKSKEAQRPIGEDIERRRVIVTKLLEQVKGLGDGSEKEVEGFFNLIYAHLFFVFPPNSPEAKQHLTRLLQTISTTPTDRLYIKYRILSNLFNTLPRTSPLRRIVYNTLLDIASQNDDLDALRISRSEVEKWLLEWDISGEEKAEFLKTIVDAYSKAGQLAPSYEYSLEYIRKLPSTSQPAQAAAVEAIAVALRLPNVYDFDPLFKLDAIVALKDHELFSLLQVFLNYGLTEFNAWVTNNPGTLEKYDLSRPELERKIRLLTLASLGFQHVGQNLSYSKIASSLQIDTSDVEKWVIDVIRAGLVWGKLSQNAQSMHVTRATSRSFEREQWETLEKRLISWKAGLAGVLDVVANAKRLAGHAPAQLQATA